MYQHSEEKNALDYENNFALADPWKDLDPSTPGNCCFNWTYLSASGCPDSQNLGGSFRASLF